MSYKEKTKVLFLAAEAAPLAKVGGLGDVAGALPPALFELGADIRLRLPFYGCIDKNKYGIKKIKNYFVDIAGHSERAEIWETVLPGTKVKIYLIKHKFFNAKEIYHLPKKNGIINFEFEINKYVFFTKASLSACEAINFHPDVVHVNDWHVALAGDMIKTLNEKTDFFKETKVLYTIHNMAMQGIAGPKAVDFAQLDSELPQIKNDLLDNDLNLMVQGILGSDLVNTVSPSYAKEILSSGLGAGLEKIAKKRSKDIYGILNGLDIDFYNPQKDKFIYKKYSSVSPDPKKQNKKYLEKLFGFTPADTPIAAIVSRLSWQKGLDLITEKIFELPIRLIILGTGDKEIEIKLKKLAKKYPDKLKLAIKFDEKLAHQIYAGSDIFLMPSRFEPCGLGQMIAMRYGTVPVVRSTGGLRDTVNNKTGFKFQDYCAIGLYKALEKCLRAYNNKNKWQKLVQNGMFADFPWSKSAKKYLSLYRKLNV